LKLQLLGLVFITVYTTWWVVVVIYHRWRQNKNKLMICQTYDITQLKREKSW